MSIIINDFEIISPPPSDSGQAARNAAGMGAEDQAEAATMINPAEIERIIHRSIERRRRLWAD